MAESRAGGTTGGTARDSRGSRRAAGGGPVARLGLFALALAAVFAAGLVLGAAVGGGGDGAGDVPGDPAHGPSGAMDHGGDR